MKTIVDQTAERLRHLENYVISCLQDSSIAWADLTDPSAFLMKLMAVIRKDATHVLKKMAKRAAIAVGEQLLQRLKGV